MLSTQDGVNRGSSSSLSTSITARCPSGLLEPRSHRTVGVLAHSGQRLLVAIVAAHEHAHVNVVIPLVDDDLADAVVEATERDAKLELADAPLPEPERVGESLRVAVGTAWRPLVKPRRVSLLVPNEAALSVVVRPALPWQ
jgi:hypothetical protein